MDAGYLANHNGGYLPQTPAHTPYIPLTRTNPTRRMPEASLLRCWNDHRSTTINHRARALVRAANHLHCYFKRDDTTTNHRHQARVQDHTTWNRFHQDRNRPLQDGLPTSSADPHAYGSNQRTADSRIGDAAGIKDVRMYLGENRG